MLDKSVIIAQSKYKGWQIIANTLKQPIVPITDFMLNEITHKKVTDPIAFFKGLSDR